MIPVREKKELMLHKTIPVMIQGTPNYDVPSVVDAIQKRIPRQMVSGLDYVLIGDSDYMNDRDIDALYTDGIIYMSPEMQDQDEATLSVVHEIAHLIEEQHPQIYEDQTIETEFLGKRNKLKHLFDAHDIKTSHQDFLNAEYSEKFDDYLYLSVGYPVVRTIASGLFMSPYAATSVREYFADAVEEYFMRDPSYVKLVSPAVYFKIEELLDVLGEKFL